LDSELDRKPLEDSAIKEWVFTVRGHYVCAYYLLGVIQCLAEHC
jgi:hypothetical protein